MENDCREAFEKWFHPVGGKGLERDRQGYYTFMVARNAWNAWQAAWSARASDVPSGYSVKGERHTELKDGEAERNECDCLRRPDSEGMPAVLNPASPTTQQSEILDNKFTGFSKVLTCSYDGEEYLAFLPDEIAPYLRTTEPVSVSLEKVRHDGKPPYVDYETIKRVLDAAGVKYVD